MTEPAQLLSLTPPPPQVTCFEQAAPHGDVLCSQQFRDALVANGLRPDVADPATARIAAVEATASAPMAVSSIDVLGAPPPARSNTGRPQAGALCPVVRSLGHRSLLTVAQLCRAGGDVTPPTPPSGHCPAASTGRPAGVDLSPVVLAARAHKLEGDSRLVTEFAWPSFASSRFASGAFSALATLPPPMGLYGPGDGPPGPAQTMRPPSFESVKRPSYDACSEISLSGAWQPIAMRPSYDTAAPDLLSVSLQSRAHFEVRGPRPSAVLWAFLFEFFFSDRNCRPKSC